MKKLATLAFAVLATSAFAAPPGNGNGSGGHHGGTNTPSISISGTSVQSASLIFTAVRNKAENGGVAVQNIASNAGNVTIGGDSNQSVRGLLSDVSNSARGQNAYASQNLASNLGDVTIRGSSSQSVGMFGAYVANSANAASTAVQNVASNNACVSCNE